MKKVIITGAGGFIGGALTNLLLGKGITVYGVDVSEKRLQTFKGNKNFFPVIADFSQYDRLYEMIDDNDVDVFYHFAWQGVFGDAFKNHKLQLDNAKYSCDALMQAIKIGCKKFVFAGTVNEYELNTYVSMDYFEPRYTYIYSTAKHAAESIGKTLAFNNKIEYCCGRIAMAYGENNYSKMIPNVVINNLINSSPCKLIQGENPYDMIYISDIANAFFAIGENGHNMKSYYIGHREIRTFKDIIKNIAEIINPDCPLLFGEYPDVPSGVNYDDIDLDMLYNDTGFECQADFKESILKTAEWIKSLNWEA